MQPKLGEKQFTLKCKLLISSFMHYTLMDFYIDNDKNKAKFQGVVSGWQGRGGNFALSRSLKLYWQGDYSKANFFL